MRLTTIVGLCLFLFACKTKNDTGSTKRLDIDLKKIEQNINLPVKGYANYYSYFTVDTSEYYSYLYKNKIYILDINNKKDIDSINVYADTSQLTKYGEVMSFCFSGKDSLFVSLYNAIFFVHNKTLSKIIPLNELDTIQYPNIMFFNLEDAPISFDKKTNEIIGEVYCSGCGQSEPAFYKQKSLGHISLATGKLSLYNITYPDKYIKNYYGFGNHLYTDSYDSLVLTSFPFDENMYLFNRNSNNIIATYPARSKYQKTDAQPLSLDSKYNIEDKMRHLTVSPYYREIRYDRYRKLYYKFFQTDIPLKDEKGKYNNFANKKSILMVLNSNFEVLAEYDLTNDYQDFYSFVGKAGLYIVYGKFSEPKTNNYNFKILTFKK